MLPTIYKKIIVLLFLLLFYAIVNFFATVPFHVNYVVFIGINEGILICSLFQRNLMPLVIYPRSFFLSRASVNTVSSGSLPWRALVLAE